MATALEVIEGSLKLLGIKPAETPIQPEEAQDGLDALNDMMSGWEEKFIHLGFINMTDVDDDMDVPDSIIGGIKSNLAVYVAPEYGRVVTNELATRARKDYKDIRAAYVRLQPASYPDTLPQGSGNKIDSTGYDGDRARSDILDTFYPENEKRNF